MPKRHHHLRGAFLIFAGGLYLLQVTTPRRVQAQEPSVRALWVADTNLGIDADVLLKKGVEKSLQLQLTRPAELKKELEAFAQRVPKINDQKFNRQLLRARQAYLNLKLNRADRAYRKALQEVYEHPLSLPNSKRLARVYFEKSQISDSKRNRRQAKRELRMAMTLNPRLQPDPDRFGPPQIRAAKAMKRKLSQEKLHEITVQRAPNDAQVFINGIEVPPNQKVRLRGLGPHLLTAQRIGYQAFIKQFDLRSTNERELAIVMKPAVGAVLAQQVLAKWIPVGSAQRENFVTLSHDLALQFAKVLKLDYVVEARASNDDHVELKLSRVKTAEIERSVRGRQLDWEPWPFAVATEALAGRTLERPDLDALLLALSAPTRVNAKEEIELVVQIRDSASQLKGLEVHCGDETKKQKISGIKEGSLSLSLDAPTRQGTVKCNVFGLDSKGEQIVRAPPEDKPLMVAIDDPLTTPWYGKWYVWTAVVTAVAAGGASAAYFSARADPPEEHRLVFNIQ